MVKEKLEINDDTFIGTFVYGSQNYGLNDNDSDTDTITIVLNAKKSNQEILFNFGKAKVYTFQYFIQRLRCGDLECYEILYTTYKVVNSKYKDFVTDFIDQFSSCMSYERIKNSLSNKLEEHLNHVLWIFRNEDGSRYNKKRLYWSIRVYNQLKRINEGESFKDSLVYVQSSENNFDLQNIKKKSNHLSNKQFSEIYKYLANFAISLPRYCKEVLEEEENLFKYYISLSKLDNSRRDEL